MLIQRTPVSAGYCGRGSCTNLGHPNPGSATWNARFSFAYCLQAQRVALPATDTYGTELYTA